MTIKDFINRLPNSNEFSRKSIILLFSYYLRKYKGIVEFSTQDIRQCFKESLIRVPTNLSKLLKELSSGRNSPFLKNSKKNIYSLSLNGLNEVENFLVTEPNPIESYNEFIKTALPYLKRVISKVNNENRKKFLAEAIACLGVEARRATIILTWLTTMDHLYDYILTKKLFDFNSALSKRSDKYGKLVISTKDDFSDLKESIFIEVTRSAKIITNDIRKILNEKLGIRNTAAHPSTIEIHDSKVVNFVEDLVDNIIVKYKL